MENIKPLTVNSHGGRAITIFLGASPSPMQMLLEEKDVDVLIEQLKKAKEEVRVRKYMYGDWKLLLDNGWSKELFDKSCEEFVEENGFEPETFLLSSSYAEKLFKTRTFAQATKKAKAAFDKIRPNNTVIWDTTKHEDLDDGMDSPKWVTRDREEAAVFEEWMFKKYVKPYFK